MISAYFGALVFSLLFLSELSLFFFIFKVALSFMTTPETPLIQTVSKGSELSVCIMDVSVRRGCFEKYCFVNP